MSDAVVADRDFKTRVTDWLAQFRFNRNSHTHKPQPLEKKAMPVIADFETIPEMFAKLWAHYDGQNRTVLSYKDKNTKEWVDISWEELRRLVQSMAGYLHKRGVRPGDRVAILSENRPEWVVTDLGTQFLGGINVSLYTSLPPQQVAYILQDSGSKIFVVSTSIQLKKAEQVFDDCPDLEEIITMSEIRKERSGTVRTWDEVLAEGEEYWNEHKDELIALRDNVKPDDISALIYTSGTTGLPKGVMLTHKNFCSNVKSAVEFIGFYDTDHHLSFLPLCHSFERTAGYTAVLSCGARISYAESIDTVSRNLIEVKPTVMISVPRLFEKVYNTIAKSVEEGSAIKRGIFNWSVNAGKKASAAKKNGKAVGPLIKAQQAVANRLVFSKLHEKLGGNLRFAVSGGAALPRVIGEFFEAAGIILIEGYGLTETAPVLCCNPYDSPRYGTVGWALPGITVGIQRLDDGKMLGQLNGYDYPSNLTTEEGEIVAKGPNIMKGYWNNEEETRKVIDPDGWYHTGDVGHFADGYLVITDRIKHMIVSAGGKNIYPGPIEEVFKTVPAIDQILVIGEGREFLTALVVPNMDILKQFAQENNISFTDEKELLEKSEILAIFDQEFKNYSKNAAAHEKIRDFRLLSEPFTVENNMMTPTLKLRRREIERVYADLIEDMYAHVK
jgi:long-chain acyl-CoA synthetase